MPGVLKAAALWQNTDEYRAHSAHLDTCLKQTKTGIIIMITFTLTERDEHINMSSSEPICNEKQMS